MYWRNDCEQVAGAVLVRFWWLVSTCLIAKRCRYSSAELSRVLNCSNFWFSISEHNDRMPVSDNVQTIVAATCCHMSMHVFWNRVDIDLKYRDHSCNICCFYCLRCGVDSWNVKHACLCPKSRSSTSWTGLWAATLCYDSCTYYLCHLSAILAIDDARTPGWKLKLPVEMRPIT